MNRLSPEVKDLVCELFHIGAFKFGNYKMKVGKNSPVYFDLRVVVSFPIVMEKVSCLMLKFIEQLNIKPKVICGVPYTALPIATIVSVKSITPMLIRRKEPKKYGTMKLIEGTYSAGDTCLIIEDIVTTGGSILETVKDLRHDGMLVSDAIVIVDREQGGILNLKNNGINMHCLFTLAEALEVLMVNGKIDKNTVLRVSEYIKSNQMFQTGELIPEQPTLDRRKQTYSDRAALSTCSLSKRLFNLMEKKKSNLCIAIDVSNSNDLIKLTTAVGLYAVVLKTHFDAISDWSDETEKQLISLSKTLDFIILEDRKYCDIGNTVKLQMNRVSNWADAVTMHSIAGPSIIPVACKPIFLVAQLSSAGNLISSEYAKATISFAENNPENVTGIVCQDGDLIKSPGLIQLTPGVSLQKGVDALDQQYATPEEAVLNKGGDLIVVGRAVTTSSEPEKVASELKNRLWKAYEQRVNGNK